jgi:hypothetical protein
MHLNLLQKGGMLVSLFSLALIPPSGSKAKEFDPNNPLNPPPPIFWCPDRTPDQQIAATQQPGCKPLVDEEEIKARKDKKAEAGVPFEEKPDIKIYLIQNEASKFVQQYREFLECCANNTDSIETIDDLIDEADHILKSVQQKGIFNSAGFGKGAGGTAPGPGDGSGSGGLGGLPGQTPKLGTFARQWTISEIVRTVSQARHDLQQLQNRLEALAKAKDAVETLGFEAEARERRRMEEEEHAIQKEFQAKKPPESARTGMEIQDTTVPTRIGGDIEDTTLKNTFGADVGDTVSPYSNIKESIRLRNATDVQDTNLPTRVGPAIEDSNTPNAIGFEIGTPKGPTGPSTNPTRVGPNIGDSSSNQRR